MGAVFALLVVIAVTLVAFHVTAAGVFDEPPTVRLHVGSQLAGPRPNLTDHTQVDETVKLSVAKSESQATPPACNYKACAEAYRSFNAGGLFLPAIRRPAPSVPEVGYRGECSGKAGKWLSAGCPNPFRFLAGDEADHRRSLRTIASPPS